MVYSKFSFTRMIVELLLTRRVGFEMAVLNQKLGLYVIHSMSGNEGPLKSIKNIFCVIFKIRNKKTMVFM